MVWERLKRWVRPREPALEAGHRENPERASLESWDRHSHGLEEFSRSLAEEEGLRILDCGEVLQANVSFLTSYGHKLYSEAFLSVLDSVRGMTAPEPSELTEDQIQRFLDATLNFPDGHLGAVLLWDTLTFLPGALAEPVVERLAQVMRPGACLLALFHADLRKEPAPLYSYRIVAADTLHVTPKGWRKPAQVFNNRAIEKLFRRFHSVKFFLARDHLREVIVRR